MASGRFAKARDLQHSSSSLLKAVSATGEPCYITEDGRAKAVLMDIDGTSVRSEHFRIWIIEQTSASLLGDKNFKLSEQDTHFVSTDIFDLSGAGWAYKETIFTSG